MTDSEKIISRWDSLFSKQQWLNWMIREIKYNITIKKNTIVLIGSSRLLINLLNLILKAFSNSQINSIYIFPRNKFTLKKQKIIIIDNLSQIKEKSEKVIFVACSTQDIEVTEMFKLILKHKTFLFSPFVYKIKAENWQTKKDKSLFVATVFNNKLVNEVYNFASSKTHIKCERAEADEIYQFLLQTKNIKGSIAEFGSYEGHSGLILCTFMKKLKISKKLYLCDTFHQFPIEKFGIDQFWSKTHKVNFNHIKRLFESYSNVFLVKGDFAKTIAKIPENHFSFVYVDCDSNRAVNLVINQIYPKLSRGGIMCFEDYGHAHCLGARFAVDQYFQNVSNCFRFFSARSGMQIIIKY